MFLSLILGVSISIVGFSTLVAADPTSVVTLKSVQVSSTPNDYFDPWSVEITKGQQSSQLNAKIPTKKDIPETMLLKFVIILGGMEPIEYETTLCEALTEDVIGKSITAAGTPKGQFPVKCPFTAGDWGIVNWDPPTHMIPPGVPDGPVSGYMEFKEEGKAPYVKLDYDGELSHALPTMMGR
ncbi:uncharacterized protein [Venturia canescens]|uniref:uncharacterized protein n=1 Tax=Venturia canescens TaxID=32260 RepID=UPI001C9C743F|nr:uncharacterized protein LOC122406847 [Venturia canescens]